MIPFRSQLPALLFIASLIPYPANACINSSSGTSIHGGRTKTGSPMRFWELKASLNGPPGMHMDRLIARGQLQPGDDFPEQEATGVAKVFMGDYDAAIKLFEEVEASHPGRYTNAANLGTAYELHGDLELALKWISEGMRRNPDSHNGTEWLHVEIIKTRMKLRDNPQYLRNHHVIDLPESFTTDSKIEIAGKEYTGSQLLGSLFYQLKERMIFVKPKDPVVADLLYTFGDLEGRTHALESGLRLLEWADQYGIQDPAALDAKISHFKWLIRFRMLWQTLLIVGLPVVLLILCYKKKWFFLSRKAEQEHRMSVRENRCCP